MASTPWPCATATSTARGRIRTARRAWSRSDYVYVTDVADATWRAATQALPAPALLDARAFNVGTGVATSVVRLAEVLRDAARSDVGIEYAPKRPGEQQESYVDVTKAARQLDWQPTVSLEEGLARTYGAFAALRAVGASSTRSH